MLECGGKRGATPLSTGTQRSQALSPLRSASAVQNAMRGFTRLAFWWSLLVISFAQIATAETNTLRFLAVDVIVDSQDQPLAAYQIDLKAPPGTRIVGIEGGAPAAFSEPPHYDPKAIQGEQVILGAFSTLPERQLPKGRTRVATIHLQSEKAAVPEFVIQSATAANAKGSKIKVQTTVEERKGESK
jgi:hypothetical protein